MSLLSVIPPSARVEDTCDFCYRAFARAAGATAVCPSCGLENPRGRIANSASRSETAMLAAPRNNMRPSPKSRPRRGR